MPLWPDVGRWPRLLCRRDGPASLRRLYRVTNAFLRDLGVDYWLAYGTLLGYHREGDLLAGDRDVDFGLPEAAYPEVKRGRLPRGFRLFDTSRRHHGPKLYVEHGGWEADLYFYRQAPGDCLRSCERSRNPGDLAPLPRSWLFPLQPATFLGEPTRVPARVEDVLRRTYGYLGRNARRDRATGYFVWIRP